MNEVIKKITETATRVHEKINKKVKPEIKIPIRALSNVNYDPKVGFFELKGAKKKRELTVNTIKSFAQSLKMMGLSKQVVESNDMATKREAYYVSKNWGDARFNEQTESDSTMDDIEAMFMVNREQLGFIPEEKGGDIAGKLIVIDKDPTTGKEIKIDCTKFGSGAYSIPSLVEQLKFETDAKFILAIETAGMFQRLVKHNYWKTSNCILISMGGVPTRACRRFIRRLADDKKLPVYVFTDGDPYGYMSIYRTLKVGSGNAAHINKYFCVPQAKFLGVTPEDIDEYKLPTHPLKDVDKKKIKDVIKNDPFVKQHKDWEKALQLLQKKGQRVEQQALAAHGLNFVLETYLPEKLKKKDKFLP
ncbi:DNA topoisomerase IV subunit A [archaeon]|jgi:DNA topoisomerase VI subunit A|nr:DNA topoisomerase IV subunit A [archaeon]MBT6824047.1 DNA topoisomerase IV subunit A [archaeon]MBT7107108.1 DNA topoisomerase IV subunit A [archaeon]MBT7297720.1 DNA topoisomerase IV subunit A [archaeon]